MRYVQYIFCLLFFALSINTQVFATVGVNLAYPINTKDPAHLYGYDASMWYNPETLKWKKINLYFDINYSHWWVTNYTFYHSTSIIAIAPILRYSMNTHTNISPYAEISIGPGYVTHTHLGTSKLGMHLIFQDRLGFGAFVGPSQRLSIGFHILHFSNASLCKYNAGITAPLMFDIGYKF